MRIEQKADSEEEEYEASDDADSSVDISENETKSAKQSATSKSPAASKGKRVRKSTMLRVYFLINRYKTIVLMLCRRERADKQEEDAKAKTAEEATTKTINQEGNSEATEEHR